MIRKLVIPLLFVTAVCIGCSDEGDSPTAPGGGGGGGTSDTISFANDIAPLITAGGCLGSNCHGGSASSGGLNLGNGSYSSVRNASGGNGPIIIANNANSSNFYLKLTANPPFGSRMPLNGNFLSDTNLDKVRDWINQGAQDN